MSNNPDTAAPGEPLSPKDVAMVRRLLALNPTQTQLTAALYEMLTQGTTLGGVLPEAIPPPSRQ
jgi:hypothetical protein